MALACQVTHRLVSGCAQASTGRDTQASRRQRPRRAGRPHADRACYCDPGRSGVEGIL